MERQRDFFDDYEEPQEPLRHTQLRELVDGYVDVEKLRLMVASGEDIRRAIRYQENLPFSIDVILETIKVLFTPDARTQIRSPHDVAALLMLEMGRLQQEEMRIVCLDTKNRIQKLHTVYKGSLNTSLIRIGELFKEPIRLNSAAIIACHNHPSTDPTPSPEDVMITREIVSAGKLLDIDVLDHLVVAEQRWVSMRERGLGFNR